jgi:16S rRNA (guanine(966)-N(2))-methyltransferase RsmD
MFSILGDRIVGSHVMDLYAGTGSLGIEALSRGAAHVTFVEEDRTAGRILHANLDRCRGFSPGHIEVCVCRVEIFLRRVKTEGRPYDLVLADPPYADTADLIDAMHAAPAARFADGGTMVIEHGKKTELPPVVGPYRFMRRYDYGDTSLTLFHHAGESVGSS